MEEDDYWNKSDSKAFSFDDDERMPQPSTSRRDVHLIHDDNVSEMSFELPAIGSEIPINLLISEQDLQTVLEEQCLSEVQIRKGTTVEEELRILRRSVQDRIHPPTALSVINKIVGNQPISLECFRSLSEKESLLDESILSGNGDAILAIVLFLWKTLKRSLVVVALASRPSALDHYIVYLTKRHKHDEILQLLSDLGKITELALYMLNSGMKQCRDGYSKMDKLQNIYANYFQQPGINKLYSNVVQNYLQLLKWQSMEKQIQFFDSKLFDSTVLQTVYYSCSMHKWSDLDPAAKYNPQHLVEAHRVSQAQFEWVSLNERARSQAWKDLEGLFEKKSWRNLKAKSFATSIPLDRVVLRLFNLDAPIAVLNFFLAQINDPQRRLVLARKVGAHKSVTDALVELKDRQGLDEFVQSIAVGTDVRFYAENALKNLRSKWNADNLKLLKN